MGKLTTKTLSPLSNTKHFLVQLSALCELSGENQGKYQF